MDQVLQLPEREIIICGDVDELNRKAAEQFIGLACNAIEQSGRFAVALSGGSTPKALYSLLASPDYRERVDWSRVHLFWGDERCVPPDHAESNFRMGAPMVSGVSLDSTAQCMRQFLFSRLLFDLSQLLADLFVGCAFLVVDLDELPAHGSLRVDHEGRRMRPAAAVGIKNPVPVDYFVLFVFEERKIKLSVETVA